MSSTTTLPLPTISPHVNAFALQHGLESYLPVLVAAARRIFPDARIEVHIEDDPEISGNEQIVFEVDENGRDAAEQVAAHQKWAEELARSCPASHVHFFCLIQGQLT
jgi:hypothetical protein